MSRRSAERARIARRNEFSESRPQQEIVTTETLQACGQEKDVLYTDLAGRYFYAEDDGTLRKLYVHDAVASAFLPNPENKPFVRHKNGNRHDNRAANLEWSTEPEPPYSESPEDVSHGAQVDQLTDALYEIEDFSQPFLITLDAAWQVVEQDEETGITRTLEERKIAARKIAEAAGATVMEIDLHSVRDVLDWLPEELNRVLATFGVSVVAEETGCDGGLLLHFLYTTEAATEGGIQ